jgi:AcrR family transcriptional regulator
MTPAPPGPGRSPRVPGEVRKAQILRAAAELFDTRGYHETSMTAIAERTGIRKASLYYHFPGKDALLVQMHQQMIDLIIAAQLERVRRAELTPSDLLQAMMTDLVSLMETHPGHLRIFFEHYRGLPGPIRAEISGKRDRYQQLLVDVLEQGAADGSFTLDDPRLTALAVLGMCNWTYQWFRPGAGHSAAEVAHYFHQMLLTGLQSGPQSVPPPPG